MENPMSMSARAVLTQDKVADGASYQAARQVGGDARTGRSAGPLRSDPMPLVGRDDELVDIGDIVVAAFRAVGGLTVVKGLPGVGKSSVLREIARLAGEAGITVAFANAQERQRTTPLSTLRAVFDSCPKLRSRGSRRGRRSRDLSAYAEWAGDALDAYTLDERLVVLVDDAHNVDEASAVKFRELATSSLTVQWVFAFRPDTRSPRSTDLLSWFEARQARIIELTDLDETAGLHLCANLLGAWPDGRLARQKATAWRPSAAARPTDPGVDGDRAAIGARRRRDAYRRPALGR
jgi:hypothetical protein